VNIIPLTIKTASIATLFACIGMSAFAGESASPAIINSAGGSELASDLTLGNFFTEGWDQDWSKRPHLGGAPDMALLRVQTNFLEQEVRADYYFQNDLSSASKKDIHFADSLVTYGVNRRLMLAVVGSYQWTEPRPGHKELEGMSEAFLGRLQLVDTEESSYAFNFRAQAPNDGIGNKQTTLSYALAGWNDLTPLGLPRVGLYYHVLEDNFLGTGAAGARRNDLTWAMSLAKTWTEPDAPVIRNFTTFLECFNTTDLDGVTSGRTTTGLTPGIRFTLGKGHVIMAGVDIPMTTPRPYSALYRLTYIYNY